MGDRRVVAAIKPVAPVTGVDWLTGAVDLDARHLERSPADAAACAVALSIASILSAQAELVAVSGPRSEPLLRAVGAEGFATVTRIVAGDDADSEAPEDQLDSAAVAVALAQVLGDTDVVVCGEASTDRSSGTVPARLAELLGRPQALCLHEVRVEGAGLAADRRFEGGRVERLSVPLPCVISVLPRAGTGQRAPLRDLLAAREVERVEVGSEGAVRGDPEGAARGPWRPAASDLPAPTEPEGIRRALEVAGARSRRGSPEVVRAAPDEAARSILEHLEAWGLR